MSSLTSFQEKNLRYLYVYHFLNSIAITVAASFLFTDKLLLRMNISLDSFGLIKGIYFSVPTILNFLFSPYMQNLNKDRQIMAWGYMVRVFLPLLVLPLPFFINNRGVLGILVTLIFSISVTAAIFANNSASVLWKKVIPPGVMGRHAGSLSAVSELPFCFAAVLCSWILDRCASGGDMGFYLAFMFLQLGTGIFQIPALFAVMRVNIPPAAENRTYKKRFRFSDFMIPFRDRVYIPVLVQIFLQSLLTAQLGAYFFPYLLNQCSIPMRVISTIEMFLAVMAIFLYSLWGRFNERFGSWNLLKICMTGSVAAILFLLGGSYVAVLIFSLLFWQAARGIFGVGLMVSGKVLSLEFCSEERPNLYMAAGNLSMGAGFLTGYLISSAVFSILSRIFPYSPGDCYTLFFATCLVPCAVLYFYSDVNKSGPSGRKVLTAP